VAKWSTDAANIAAERDAAEKRAEVAEAELARIRAADRTSITVRTETAAQMRKGQAI
jgi:hypothetical protein